MVSECQKFQTGRIAEDSVAGTARVSLENGFVVFQVVRRGGATPYEAFGGLLYLCITQVRNNDIFLRSKNSRLHFVQSNRRFVRHPAISHQSGKQIHHKPRIGAMSARLYLHQALEFLHLWISSARCGQGRRFSGMANVKCGRLSHVREMPCSPPASTPTPPPFRSPTPGAVSASPAAGRFLTPGLPGQVAE